MFLFILALFIYCFYLHHKVSSLELTLKGKNTTKTHSTEPLPTPTTMEPALPIVEQAVAATPQKIKETSIFNQEVDILGWLKTNFLLKLGSFLVLLSMSWFVSYAFAENWIGPVGRILLGLLLGSSMFTFGEWRNRASLNQATVFLSLGTAIVLLTVYAAQTIYGFFSPLTTFLLLSGAVTALGLSSVRHKQEARAFVSLFFASLVPFLIESSSSGAIELFSYMLLIVVSTSIITKITKWRRLQSASLFVFVMYSLLGLTSGTLEQSSLLYILFAVLHALFFYSTFINRWRDEETRSYEYANSFMLCITLFIWITTVIPTNVQAVTAVISATVYLVASFALYRKLRSHLSVIEHYGVGLALLALTANILLSEIWAAVAYSMLVTTAIVLNQFFIHRAKVTRWLALLYIPTLSAQLYFDYSSADRSIEVGYNSTQPYTSNYEYLILALAHAVEFSYLCYLNFKNSRSSLSEMSTSTSAYMFAALGTWSFFIWRIAELSLTESIGHAISLIVFTLAGLWLYITGRTHQYKVILHAGFLLLTFVVLRLLIVEVWLMPIVGRVIVFSLIGVLLMSTTFIKPKTETTQNQQ